MIEDSILSDLNSHSEETVLKAIERLSIDAITSEEVLIILSFLQPIQDSQIPNNRFRSKMLINKFREAFDKQSQAKDKFPPTTGVIPDNLQNPDGEKLGKSAQIDISLIKNNEISCKNCGCELVLDDSEVKANFYVCPKCNIKSALRDGSGDVGASQSKRSSDQPQNTGYLRRHFRGEISLGRSFWINLCAINFFLSSGSRVFLENCFSDYPPSIAKFSLFVYAFSILIYPWQIIGLWRSSKKHSAEYHTNFWPRIVQLLVALSVILVIAGNVIMVPVYNDLFKLGFCSDEFSNYNVTWERDKTAIHVKGGLGFGVSERVLNLIKENPTVKAIIIDSPGGRIYEGRALANLIIKNCLISYSLSGCYSAGTIAFIAGKKRYISRGANLGFHRYRMVGGIPVNMDDEEKKDLVLFRTQGVSEAFIKNIYTAGSDDLWYPTIQEMFAGNVIHGIVNQNDFSIIESESHESDAALKEVPAFICMKKYDPKSYDNLLAILKKAKNEGTGALDVQATIRKCFQDTAFKRIQFTSNKAVLEFFKSLVEAMKKLNSKDPILCLKFIYPEKYGELNLGDYFSKDEVASLSETFGKVIIDSYEVKSPFVDPISAKGVFSKVRERQPLGWSIPDVRNLRNHEQYKQHCEALIHFYEEIFSESEKDAGNALKSLFLSNG